MMNSIFNSAQDLSNYLSVNGSYTFVSKPKKLKQFTVLLQALAGGDFNPAHIVSGFEDYSLFKGIVSHGIGIISRAEGEFVNSIQFNKQPVEIIAAGFEFVKYSKPLRVGYVYQYEFKIYNLEKNKKNWNFDCDIVCKTISPETEIIASWRWKPIFVENLKIPKNKLEILKPKSYFINVFKYLFFEPISNFSLILFCNFIIFFGPVVILLQCLGLISVVDCHFEYCF